MKKILIPICLLVLILSISAYVHAGKPTKMPKNMRVYEGVTCVQVAGTLKGVLEKERFFVVDMDEEADGDVTFIAQTAAQGMKVPTRFQANLSQSDEECTLFAEYTLRNPLAGYYQTGSPKKFLKLLDIAMRDVKSQQATEEPAAE